MGAAAREQPRGASTGDSRTDEPRRRALHGQHSRANARETEQMCGDSSSGGAHFSMCTFDRASGYAAGGEARWGLPLTPSEGWTLPEGAQVQCPRGVLASKGVTGTYSATGFGALVRSSAASLRDDGRLESSCWARGTSSVRIPVGYEGSAVGRVAEGWEPFALRSDFCATTRNVFPRPPTRSTAARARTIYLLDHVS